MYRAPIFPVARLFTGPLNAALGLSGRTGCDSTVARALTADSDYPMALLYDAARAQS